MECVFGVLLVVFINLALLQLLTTETGYCRARWVSVVRSPLRAARWPDVVLRAATPRVCSNRPWNAVVVSVVAVSTALMDIIW